MNIGKTLAQKAKRASQATKSYFGFAEADNCPPGVEQPRAAANAGQMRAKIKAVLEP